MFPSLNGSGTAGERHHDRAQTAGAEGGTSDGQSVLVSGGSRARSPVTIVSRDELFLEGTIEKLRQQDPEMKEVYIPITTVRAVVEQNLVEALQQNRFITAVVLGDFTGHTINVSRPRHLWPLLLDEVTNRCNLEAVSFSLRYEHGLDDPDEEMVHLFWLAIQSNAFVRRIKFKKFAFDMGSRFVDVVASYLGRQVMDEVELFDCRVRNSELWHEKYQDHETYGGRIGGIGRLVISFCDNEEVSNLLQVLKGNNFLHDVCMYPKEELGLYSDHEEEEYNNSVTNFFAAAGSFLQDTPSLFSFSLVYGKYGLGALVLTEDQFHPFAVGVARSSVKKLKVEGFGFASLNCGSFKWMLEESDCLTALSVINITTRGESGAHLPGAIRRCVRSVVPNLRRLKLLEYNEVPVATTMGTSSIVEVASSSKLESVSVGKVSHEERWLYDIIPRLLTASVLNIQCIDRSECCSRILFTQ